MPEAIAAIGQRSLAAKCAAIWKAVRPAASPQWAPIAVAACAILTLQFNLVFAKSINWDEFFYFSLIEQLREGMLTHALQTFHTRLFGFLRLLPLDSIGQLIAGRVIMLGCEIVTAFAIFGIARRFCEDRVAALCALTYVSSGYVFLHAFAFRADPLATALLMSALWCLITRAPTWPMVGVLAVLVGLAGAVTIKVIFYLPPLLGAAWLRMQQEKAGRRWATGARIAASAFLSVLVVGLLMLWHRSGVQLGISRGGVASSALDTVFAAGLVPQARYLWQQILFAPYTAMLVVAAPLFWNRFPDGQRVALATFLLPLVTVAFYRNSYPYYFVFILAPAMTTVGPALQRLLSVIGYWPYAAVLALSTLLLNIAEPRQILANQRSLVGGVHHIFPTPVAHFGFSGMIGDFPRPMSILVSGWGLQRYRNGEEPTLVELAKQRPTPLLMVNHPVIAEAVKGHVSPYGLLPIDVEMLRTNYLPYWGSVWVAGKQLPKGSKPVRTDFAVPGPYLVQGGVIAIDGRSAAPGVTVMIERGPHVLTANASADASLRWGEHLQMPAWTPPDPNALFTEY